VPLLVLRPRIRGIDATIESDLSTMYEVWLGKLDLRESPDDHRRVLAVLAYLRS